MKLVSTEIRPTGVTIIAVLVIISGIFTIGFGALFGAFLGSFMGSMGDNFFEDGGIIITALSGVMVALGILSFVMGWGLLKGKPWAWTVTLILTIISLIFAIPSSNVISLIINAVILYYLFRPHVKAYFQKSEQVL